MEMRAASILPSVTSTAMAATATTPINAMGSEPVPRTSLPHSQATMLPATMTRTAKLQGLAMTAPSATIASTTADAIRLAISCWGAVAGMDLRCEAGSALTRST